MTRLCGYRNWETSPHHPYSVFAQKFQNQFSLRFSLVSQYFRKFFIQGNTQDLSGGMSGLNTVPDNINFANEEAKVLEKWRTEKTFEKQLQ